MKKFEGLTVAAHAPFNRDGDRGLVPIFELAMFGSLAIVVASGLLGAETEITPGSAPAVSPDGRLLAFQRFDGRKVTVGVCDAADGSDVRWVDDAGFSTGSPCWTPTGNLVYSRNVGKTTAYRAFVEGVRKGFEICLDENGKVRSLTSGRFVDYSPAVSFDGRALWFVTTQGVGEGSGAWASPCSSNLARLDLTDAAAVPCVVARPLNGKNSGFICPAVSPDGRYLACGQLMHFFSGWRIVAARISEVSKGPWHLLTPREMIAHSPCWHPDGDVMCFTGFFEGDAGWGIWAMNVRTGVMARLTDGENPCFSPSGKALYFDRGGRIYRRDFDSGADLLRGAVSDADALDYPNEEVVWRAGSATDVRAGLVFGEEETFFVRVKLSAGESRGTREFLRGVYGQPEIGFVLRMEDGKAVFSVAALSGEMSEVEVPFAPTGSASLVGIRHDHALHLSVNGGAPVRAAFHDGQPMMLDHPQKVCADSAVELAEVGRGWPQGVPHLPGRKGLFE